jgi:hypothetical protein
VDELRRRRHVCLIAKTVEGGPIERAAERGCRPSRDRACSRCDSPPSICRRRRPRPRALSETEHVVPIPCAGHFGRPFDQFTTSVIGTTSAR